MAAAVGLLPYRLRSLQKIKVFHRQVGRTQIEKKKKIQQGSISEATTDGENIRVCPRTQPTRCLAFPYWITLLEDWLYFWPTSTQIYTGASEYYHSMPSTLERHRKI